MDTNVYEPPKSDLTFQNKKPGSVVKAVLIGSTIEILGTIFVAIMIGFVYGFFLAPQGSSPDDIQKTMEHIEPWSIYLVAGIFFGLLISILSGYTCARIANVNYYKAPYILSGISFSMAAIPGIGTHSWWALLLLSLISAIAVLLGARLYIRKLKPT